MAVGEKSNPLPVDAPTDTTPVQLIVKVEDRLSNGSDGSSVVDDQECPQLVDSGDSYFQNNYYMGCVATGVEAEGQQQEEEVEQLGWYICLRSKPAKHNNGITPTIVRDPISASLALAQQQPPLLLILWSIYIKFSL
ncbi:unnamed protein product [Fraxinus pennsylvanica]|uniref:Uncharacterized protein n=1 Tax=Fraxinus pennsylvanica TaxID=56036 RepID=A0AAD1YXA2_9LAMI|nr:unnamed protein product [Fraxinus pennsylvanica]